ncbi:MAG: phasin family protein [Methylobacterium sp.]|nr:phasin family protein [Rhodobacter sp.]MCA3655862.1 phasin family protein [Methylobacterium sp.]MCA3661648.1 phasin family protein [Methylobacterium sp.]MCA3663638.1 phasin family protein [Methylobacterium sp.]MCA3665805.1 phasin family protein [Methylobacterium sp.]
MASSKKPPVGGSKSAAPAPAPLPPVPAQVAAPVAPAVAKPLEAKLEARPVESKPVEMKPGAARSPEAKVAQLKFAPVVTRPASAVEAPKVEAPKIEAPKAATPTQPKAEDSSPKPSSSPKPASSLKNEKRVPIAAAPAKPMDVLKPVTVLQENVRASTEKAITVFRGQYAEVKTMAETATSQLEDSMKAAQEGSRALGFKLFEIAKAQTQAHLDHAKTLAATKSLPELLTAQQSFLVAQIEMAQSRSKDVAALAGKVANDVTAPLRASLNLLLRR